MTSLLLVILLSIHLLCMNVASAGPLLCIGLDWLSARSHGLAPRTTRWLAVKSVQLAVLGAVMGLAIGWLRWDAEFAAVLQRFSSRIRWGVVEFAFSLLVSSAYAAWIWWRPQPTAITWGLRSLLALVTSTNLLYHFPPLFALITHASSGRLEPAVVDSALFRKLIVQAEVLALTLHFALASVAVSGVALIVFAWRARVRSGDEQVAAIWGGRIALAATLLQIPVGLWLLLAVPPANQQRLIGGDLVGSVLFVVSMWMMLLLLQQLAAVAFGETTRRALVRPVQSMLFIVVAMSGVLQRLNQ